MHIACRANYNARIGNVLNAPDLWFQMILQVRSQRPQRSLENVPTDLASGANRARGVLRRFSRGSAA